MTTQSSFGKTLSAFRDAGNMSVAVFQPAYGISQEIAITVTSTAAAAITGIGTSRTLARLYSIGCPAYFKMGPTGLGAASNLDAYIPSDGSTEVIIDPDEGFIRARAVTGSGLLRIEYFR
jgi:hypothetical protein